MITLNNLKKDVYRALLEPSYAAGTLNKRLGAYLSYKFGWPERPCPESITFFLTHSCNLNCMVCGQSKTVRNSDALSLGELTKITDEVAPFNPNITLYGGEPFLYAGIGPLISYIKSKSLHLTVITNGTLLERYAAMLVNSGADVVSVSIDGPAEVHDRIRGRKGAFDDISKGVHALNEMKKRYKKRKPIINIVFTISGFNYRNMAEMPAIAASLGADTLNFHHLIFVNPDIAKRQSELFTKTLGEISGDWEGFITSQPVGISSGLLIEEMKKVKKSGASFLINFYPNFRDDEIVEYYSNPEFILKSYDKRCLSPWMTVYIYPDGSVKPCLAFDYTAGNVKENGFLNIWSGEKSRKFRETLKKEKSFPVCTRCTELYRY